MATPTRFDPNDRVAIARNLAAMVHMDRGQRYDDAPYSVHLTDVFDVLLEFDYIDKDLLAAAWLHDAVEDTGLSLETVAYFCGDKVAALVESVTDAEGATRAERKAKTYQKIKANPLAVPLKLADRIANMRYAVKTSNLRQQKMYKAEAAEFEAALRDHGACDPLWRAFYAVLLEIK
jgi:(p)ppGpp synthase/HD superfamily hydrolase